MGHVSCPSHNFFQIRGFYKAKHPRECDPDCLKKPVAFVVRGGKRLLSHTSLCWLVYFCSYNVFNAGEIGILFRTRPSIWFNLIESGAASNTEVPIPLFLIILTSQIVVPFLSIKQHHRYGEFYYKGYAGINSVVEPHIKRDQHVSVA